MVNWNINKEPKDINALLLVAHPDDETIFCGGTLLKNPEWNWNVQCLTWKKGSPRYVQFINAMETYKSHGVNIVEFGSLEHTDTGQDLTVTDIAAWEESLERKEFKPDIVFTHNTKGEYGHPHHIAVNQIATEIYKNVWEFICPGVLVEPPQPFKDNTNVVALSKEILDIKTEIFNRNYTSELSIWKVLNGVMLQEFRTGPELFTQ